MTAASRETFPEPLPPTRQQPETHAYLDLLRTHGRITTRSGEIYRRHGITEPQYHVLRVLEAAGPGGLPCLEIARQLPTPAPDITRLIERMRRGGLVQRQRLEADRRVILIDLTPRARLLAERIAPEIAAFHRQRLAHLSSSELTQLRTLLAKARGET